MTNDNLIRRQLLQDLNDFARRMRLQYVFHGKNEEPHPFHVKSNWEPPVQPSVALESYLERVTFQLAKAVAFANIFMGKVETELLNRSAFKPVVWKRYIGDMFSLWDISREELYQFIEQANNHHPRGGTPLYKVYRYVPPQRVWFLSRFGLKTGIDFDNYGLKSGRVFGAGNIYESLQTYFSSQYVTGTTN